MSEENTLQTPWTEEVLSEEPLPAAQTPYAGFWSRTLAFLIDVFLSAIVPALICFPVMFFLVSQSFTAEQMGEDISVYSVGMLATYLLWNILGALSFGYTFLCKKGANIRPLGERDCSKLK